MIHTEIRYRMMKFKNVMRNKILMLKAKFSLYIIKKFIKKNIYNNFCDNYVHET